MFGCSSRTCRSRAGTTAEAGRHRAASPRSTARCSSAASTSLRRSSRPASSRRSHGDAEIDATIARGTRDGVSRSGSTSDPRVYAFSRREGAARHDVLPARRAAAASSGSLKLAQYLPALGIETHVLAPDDPKWVHRDPELRVPTQAWIHRARYIGPRGAQAGGGASRHGRARARARPGAGHGTSPARPRRERDVEPHRDPGCDPDRAAGGHRRRDHDVAAELGPLRRRGGPARDGRALDRRPARPARREPAPARRHGRSARASGRERAGRAPRRAPRGRGHVRLGGDRGRGARARSHAAASA